MRAKNFKEVLIGAFCENGVGSAKRILGAVIIAGVMFCTIWTCVSDGMTDNNKNVVETEIIIAGALLGITSVTNIWKKPPPPQTFEDINIEIEKQKEESV